MTATLRSPAWSALRALGPRLAPFVLGVFMTACSNQGTSPAASDARLAGANRALAPGEEMSPPGDAAFVVSLVGVTQDSRCPTRVTCVWAGDAHVQFTYRFGRGPSVPFTLRLNTPLRDTVIGATRVVLDSLTPHPEDAAEPIPPANYRAWLTMESARR